MKVIERETRRRLCIKLDEWTEPANPDSYTLPHLYPVQRTVILFYDQFEYKHPT
jgi:hypothetical protein